jgi:hypothetical protein
MKNKLTGYRLQVTGLFFALLFTVTYTLTPILAATASPSASPSDNDATLKQLQKEIASKAAQYKADVTKKIGNKAFIGTVKEIQNQTLIITTKKGDQKVITDQYTNFQDSVTKKPIVLKDLSKDNFLVTLGDVDDQGSLTAKKVIRIKSFQLKDQFAVWGQIQTVLPSSITLTQANDQKFSLSLDQNTTFRLGDDEASLTDVKTSNFLISLGIKNSDNSLTSSFIYLLNPSGNLKITKTATSSATPSASPNKK